MPMFSVVMPVHNREDLVEASIQTVLDQTETDWEMIVVDDESTDATPEILNRYADRVTVIRQANAGPGAARNRGAREATGEYIAFLDSDDLWYPWTLKNYRRAIEQHQRPAFIVGMNDPFGGSGSPREVAEVDLQTESHRDYYAFADHERLGNTSATVIRTDVFRSSEGFLEGRINAEDIHLFMQIGTAPGFVVINEPVSSAYRMHQGSITRDMKRKFDGMSHCLSCHEDGTYPGAGERRRDRARILTRIARSASFHCVRAGEFSYGMNIYRRTFRDHLRAGRWKYLLGMPLFAAWRALSRRGARKDSMGTLAGATNDSQ